MLRQLAHAVMLVAALASASTPTAAQPAADSPFDIIEATIPEIQEAILSGQITATDVVNMYLARIKAYDGICVDQPLGVLGAITPIAHAGQINSLMTLNLRPAAREEWGFDAHKARSLTDLVDNDPEMPDALEVAAELDAHFAATGELVGPLHGVVFSAKDIYDTYDMRTSSGGDVAYANDRPPTDGSVMAKLRKAGAILLAKANLGEYAGGSRSAFGGTPCNPYDTLRDPGGSSSGSATSVAANLVTCAISGEGGPSIRFPSRANNIIGLSPSQGLVARDGQIGAGALEDRVGPACRTVADAARVMDVIAGWDAKDDFTVLSLGRIPSEPYASFATEGSLEGVTIGVAREYMNLELFTDADKQSVEAAEASVEVLRGLGATIVDPGAGKELLTACIQTYLPQNASRGFIQEHPDLFPEGADQIDILTAMHLDPSLMGEKGPTLRNFQLPIDVVGERRYWFDLYLKLRGDATVTDLTSMIEHSKFYVDDWTNYRFKEVGGVLKDVDAETTLDLLDRNANRIAIQQTVMHCMQMQNIDALVYPTSNVPPSLIGGLVAPSKNDRPANAWQILGQVGFPAMTVPAGFTSEVYDWVRDETAEKKMKLTGPNPAVLPIGIDFLGMPFSEPVLLRIGAAYEAATHHRRPPEGFGALRD